MSYAVPGLVMVDHELQVPLDHGARDGEQITLFAREIAEPEGREKPFLVFLQGGPGFEAPRPTSNPSGYLARALKDFRVLALDQRGTGRSTPVSGTESADYLKHFRADSIVRDAELLREALGVERWSVLGQSFGGLFVFSYRSFAPDGCARRSSQAAYRASACRSTTSTARRGSGRSSAIGATTRASRRIVSGCSSWSRGSSARTSGCRPGTG
jgi:hypothetical protein